MKEIFVEEENTVYELDAECLKQKEKQRKQKQEKNDDRIQKSEKGRRYGYENWWMLCLILLIYCK